MSNEQLNRISPLRAGFLSPDGAVAMGTLNLPFSRFASDQARSTFLTGLQPPPLEIANDIAALRIYFGAFNDQICEQMLARFDVRIEEISIGGLRAHRVVSSTASLTDCRVLVNLHGGAFMWGSGSGALVEAIPIAATSGLPVITVDYRLAPEHRYPAATQDVKRVYEELLATTPASAIGIYGCSAGAILTAQSVAQFVRDQLPAPGSIAMLGGAGLVPAGDSGYTASAMCGEPGPSMVQNDTFIPALQPYFKGIELDDPRVMPGLDAELLGRFPPSMLIAGSRDFTLSSMTTMHRRLLAQGARAELIVFDGLWHAFHIFPNLPESHEVYGLLSGFFRGTLVDERGLNR